MESLTGLLGAVSAPVLENKLVNHQALFLAAADEADGDWLTLGGFSDGFPDITLVDVDVYGLGEVEVLGPGVAVVVDELDKTMVPIFFPTVFAAVINVLASDVLQDDCPFDVNVLLPLQNFLSPDTGEARMSLEGAFEMLYHSLGNTVEVAISMRCQIYRVWIL